MERPDNAITELAWTADGADYELVRFPRLPDTRDGMVSFLQRLMNCDAETAEAA